MNRSTLLQLTDVHLLATPHAPLAGVDTEATFKATLEAAFSQVRPDALLITGDIAHEPLQSVYERFLSIVREHYSGPLACTPGNHDVLSSMVGAGLPFDDLSLGGWRVVLLDSHIDDYPTAEVTDAQVEALAARLDGSPHALVATHHHLFDVDTPWLDRDRIRSPRLLECLSKHAAVRGVVFGHVHHEVQHEYRGTRLYGTPSTCFQFEPGSQRVTFNREPPGWRQIELMEDGSIETKVGRVQGLALEPISPG